MYKDLWLIHSHKCWSLANCVDNGISFSLNKRKKKNCLKFQHVLPLQSAWVSWDCVPISQQNLVIQTGIQSPNSDETDDACSGRQEFFQDFPRVLKNYNEMWGPPSPPGTPHPVILTLSTLWSLYEIIISIWLMNLFLFLKKSIKMLCIVIIEGFFVCFVLFFCAACNIEPEAKASLGSPWAHPGLTLILALEVEALWKRWDGVEWGEFNPQKLASTANQNSSATLNPHLRHPRHPLPTQLTGYWTLSADHCQQDSEPKPLALYHLSLLPQPGVMNWLYVETCAPWRRRLPLQLPKLQFNSVAQSCLILCQLTELKQAGLPCPITNSRSSLKRVPFFLCQSSFHWA